MKNNSLKLFVREVNDVKEQVNSKTKSRFKIHSAYCCDSPEDRFNQEKNSHGQVINSKYIINDKTINNVEGSLINLNSLKNKYIEIQDFKVVRDSNGRIRKVGKSNSIAIDLNKDTKIFILEDFNAEDQYEEIEDFNDDEEKVNTSFEEALEGEEELSLQEELEKEEKKLKLVEEDKQGNVQQIKPQLNENQKRRNAVISEHANLIIWYGDFLSKQGYTREEIVSLLPSLTSSAFIELNKKGLI